MVINDIVQYSIIVDLSLISYILLVTQAPILVWFDGTIIYIISTILLQCTLQQQWLCWVMIGDCAWWLI